MRQILYLILPIMYISASNFREELGNFYWLLIFCVYIFPNHFLANEIIRLCFRFSITDDKKSLLRKNSYYFYIIIIGLPIFHIYSLFVSSETDELILFLLIIIVFSLHKAFYPYSAPEIKYISQNNNLEVGYGAALCYYENYLKLVLKEDSSKKDFLTRIRIFESRHEIQLYHKLVVLIPKSCKIKSYIDNNDTVFRCQEMEPLLMNISGIPDRKFNITVYNIRHRNRSIRLCLEYAQPLKALMAMKEKNLLSQNELETQRDIFTKNLKQMLIDSYNSHELVQLIEYDDETSGFSLEDLLMGDKSIFESSAPIDA